MVVTFYNKIITFMAQVELAVLIRIKKTMKTFQSNEQLNSYKSSK